MVKDLFDSILEELGTKLNAKSLHLDSAGTCLLSFNNGLLVNIEPFTKGDALLISAEIGEVSGGRYAEDVFREALKENALSGHESGSFGFCEQNHHLKLFSLISLKDLNADKIVAILIPLTEKAAKWKESLARGAVPLANTGKAAASSGPAGLFGLRP